MIGAVKSAAAAIPVAIWFSGLWLALTWSAWLWIPTLLVAFLAALANGVRADQKRIITSYQVDNLIAAHDFNERQIKAFCPPHAMAVSNRPYPVALPMHVAAARASAARARANEVREEAYVTGYLIGAYGESPVAILRKPPRRRSTYLELYRAAKERWIATGNVSDKLKMESYVRLTHPEPGDADYV